jgi:periplasmic protein TonB
MFGSMHNYQMPYGAYELKATYQRNLMFGNLGVLLLVTLGLLMPGLITLLFGETMVVIPVDPPPPPDSTIIIFRPPPPVDPGTQNPQPRPPVLQEQMSSQVAVVDDTSWADDQPEQMLPSRSDLSDFNKQWDDSGTASYIDTSALSTTEYFPEFGEWVPREIEPKLLHYETPVYPAIAKSAGISGTTVVMVLVDTAGKVRDARVYASSDSKMLDDAAVRAAYQNLFSPGIQNGTPVSCWVSYKVRFSLND